METEIILNYPKNIGIEGRRIKIIIPKARIEKCDKCGETSVSGSEYQRWERMALLNEIKRLEKRWQEFHGDDDEKVS